MVRLSLYRPNSETFVTLGVYQISRSRSCGISSNGLYDVLKFRSLNLLEMWFRKKNYSYQSQSAEDLTSSWSLIGVLTPALPDEVCGIHLAFNRLQKPQASALGHVDEHIVFLGSKLWTKLASNDITRACISIAPIRLYPTNPSLLNSVSCWAILDHTVWFLLHR